MKKNKLPGDNISLKTKKTEDPLVMAWLNAQTNLMDSIRYLIENEIKQSGVRNLQTYIPMERTGLQVDLNLRGAGEWLAAAAEAGMGAGTGGEEIVSSPAPSEPAVEEIDEEDIEAWS